MSSTMGSFEKDILAAMLDVDADVAELLAARTESLLDERIYTNLAEGFRAKAAELRASGISE